MGNFFLFVAFFKKSIKKKIYTFSYPYVVIFIIKISIELFTKVINGYNSLQCLSLY